MVINQPYLDPEQSLLGSILVNPSAFDEVADIVHTDDFFRGNHHMIYQLMLDLRSRNEQVNIASVSSLARDKGLIEIIGGVTYLGRLVDGVIALPTPGDYARIVKERVSGRKTILSGQKRSVPDNVNDTTSHGHFKESDQTGRTGYFKKIGHILPANIQEIENACAKTYRPTGILTGFRELDRLTNGFQPCDFIVVAGGPGMGKTSMCLDMARNAALNDHKSVGFFSFEMSSGQLITRMISALSEVEHSRIRAGMLKDGEWKRIGVAATSLSTASIYFDDSYGLTVSEVGDRAWDLKKECGLDLLFVDYIQLMLGNTGERKEQTISNISASLKALAKELNIPIIAASQLNRFARRRPGRRPRLTDLDEFPGLVQDADLILFIYRDDVNNTCSEKKGTADIIVGKNRNGPWGETYLAFLDRYATFRNIYTE